MTARHTRVLVSEVPACVTPTSRLRLIMILSPSSDVDLMRPNFSVPVSSVSLNHLICSDFLGINSRLKRRDFLVKHVHKGREKKRYMDKIDIIYIYESCDIYDQKDDHQNVAKNVYFISFNRDSARVRGCLFMPCHHTVQ